MSKEQTGREFLQAIQGGAEAFPSLCYLYGDEPYLLQEVVDTLRDAVQPTFRDFNLHLLNGAECTGDAIASVANHLPMMDTKVVVIVREAQQIAKAEWDKLLPYLQDPSPMTCLAFVEHQKKPSLDSRTKIGKILGQATVACLKPYDDKIPAWVVTRSRLHRVQITPALASSLVERLGTDLGVLDNALQRLSLYLGGKGVITEAVLDEVIVEHPPFNVFDLSGSMGRRDLQQALRLLRGLLDAGEAPLKLLSMMATAFRELLRARCELDASQGRADLSKYVPPRIPSFKREAHLRAFREQVERFSQEDLARVLRLLHETDLALKSTSGLTDDLLMERLLLTLCLPSGVPGKKRAIPSSFASR